MKPLGNRTDHYWRVQDMSAALGVDLVRAKAEGRLSDDEWAMIVEKCRGCPEPGTCDRTLANAESLDAPEPYCPNAELFKQLRKG